MEYMEYGKEHGEVIVLLHGGGLSWWNYREAAESLSADYRVILPILDGHANSRHDFVSIEANATRIIQWIDEHLGGSVLLLGGLSLGGQVALEMLSQRKDICRYALIESALCVPSKATAAMIKPAFGSCFGLIRRKWFAALQFRSLRIRQDLFDDYFRDTCAISKANMIAFLEANALYRIKPAIVACTAKAHVFVGSRENRAMQKSAQRIHKALPGSALTVLPHMVHGDFSINHAQSYAHALREIVARA